MTGQNRFKKSISRLDIMKSNVPPEIPGSLGVAIDGAKRVEVPNRPGYVYVRLRDDLSELVQVYNDKVSPVYGLAVLVTRDEVDMGRWKILGRDLGRYQGWGASPYLPVHGAQHSFNPSSPGGDPVWVWGRQFMPLGATPSGTVGGPNVIIQGPSVYYQNKDWICAGGTGTADITPSYNPTGAWARMVLVYLDGIGHPQLLGGSDYFAADLTGTCQVMSYLPDLPDTSSMPIAGIRVTSGSSALTWNNIYDLRPHIVGDGFVPTGTSGHIIQDDGAALTDRSNLNFIGTGFVTWDDAGNDATVISGTADSGETFPATRIPYAGADTYLTSHQRLWFYGDDANEASVILGGAGDLGNVYKGFNLNIIKGDDVGFNSHISLWGYGGGMNPYNRVYFANGLESSPTPTESGDPIFNEDYYGRVTGTSFSGWARIGRHFFEAIQDYTSLTTLGSRFRWQTAPTGTSSPVSSLILEGRRAEFVGDISIPSGSAAIPYPGYYYGNPNATTRVYPEGSWRTTRQNKDLVNQRLESGVWTDKQIMSNEGFVRVTDIWHVYGGFQDSDYSIPITGSVWQHITNVANDLWTGLEADGFTLSADVMTFVNYGDYFGSLSMTLSALQGKDYQIRLYNITQASQMGYEIGATTTGAGNYTNITLPLYVEANAGDQMRMEIQCTTDGTDPVLRSAVFYLSYLHE